MDVEAEVEAMYSTTKNQLKVVDKQRLLFNPLSEMINELMNTFYLFPKFTVHYHPPYLSFWHIYHYLLSEGTLKQTGLSFLQCVCQHAFSLLLQFLSYFSFGHFKCYVIRKDFPLEISTVHGYVWLVVYFYCLW